MSLRFHEIAETNHRILNPLSDEKLALLGAICAPEAGMCMLDLACGKGELLIQWARQYGIRGIGVDLSEVFIAAARKRADEMKATDQLTWVVADAGSYQPDEKDFDIVSSIGASWIGGGLVGTLQLMLPNLKPDGGLLLFGEPFWNEPPPDEVRKALDAEGDSYTSLAGTLERFESVGLTLVEMVLSNQDTWDRYEAPQWIAVDNYLREHPDDPEAEALRDWNSNNRRTYLTYGRRYMGWGVFVLRR